MWKLYLSTLLICVLGVLGGCQRDDNETTDTNETFNATEVAGPTTASAPINLDELDYFPNGIAAGDVDHTSAVLWARAISADEPITFEWSQDPSFPGSGEPTKTVDVEDPDIPVKIKITGLSQGTKYYYRVCRGESCPPAVSPGLHEKWGEFKTSSDLDGGYNRLRFGVSSCWRGDMKPFHAIKNIRSRELDFFVALGDTTYADSDQTPREPGGDPLRPQIDSPNTINHFRHKNSIVYSQENEFVKDEPFIDTSPDDNYFAQARMSTAIYATIDDHEIVNNFQGGASPDTQQGLVECQDWKMCFCPEGGGPGCNKKWINETQLFKDGLQAWQEYNPVWDDKYPTSNESNSWEGKDKLYRYRTFSKDAAIFMLDTRSFRDEPFAIAHSNDTLPISAWGRNRTMLGEAQLEDLFTDLVDAQTMGIQWKFILVPEPIQHIGRPGSPDRFEGYAYERGLILDYIRENCITNVVFISGDIHGTLANNLVYKKNFIDRNIYSSTWDISTGPAAHPEPIGPAIIEKIDLTEDELILFFYWGQESRDEMNGFFERKLNDVLAIRKSPAVGLDDETINDLFRDRQNASIPADLVDLDLDQEGVQGRYSSTNTNGWTEFEINEETRHLTVTTWGIERNEDGDLAVRDENGDLISESEYGAEINPIIVSQFVVEPREKDDMACGFGRPNGSLCGLNSACASGRCNQGVCKVKASEFEGCRRDGECGPGLYCSNDFLGGGRQCKKQEVEMAECKFDNDCEQPDLYCTNNVLPGRRVCAKRLETGRCRFDGDCTPGKYCSNDPLGFRECVFKLKKGATCRFDNDCQSHLYCTNKTLPRNQTCQVKLGRNAQCKYDTDCKSGKCTRKQGRLGILERNRICK